MSDSNGNGNDCDGPPSEKRLKIIEKDQNTYDYVTTNAENEDSAPNLKDFIPLKVLQADSNKKVASILGEFKENKHKGILVLEKKSFQISDISSPGTGIFSKDTEWEVQFKNDIYSNIECFPPKDVNALRSTLIYPATEKHIAKYIQRSKHLVEETSQFYEQVTIPALENKLELDWVYNILDGKEEQDRIIHNNPCETNGFIILPDLKWDGKSIENLYLLGIVRHRGLKSIRDLRGSHLTLLRTIKRDGLKAITEKYNVDPSTIRIYFHYQPTFYHLHIHFTSVSHQACSAYVERSHLLTQVIENIRMNADYYKDVTLTFPVYEKDSLYEAYKSHGFITCRDDEDDF